MAHAQALLAMMFASVEAKPAPIADRRAREEAAQEKVKHLVGRALVPFYLPDMTENGSLSACTTQDFGVEDIQYRPHTEGFFQEERTVPGKGEQKARSKSTPNTPMPSSFSTSTSNNDNNKTGTSKRKNSGRSSPSLNAPRTDSPARLSLSKQQQKVRARHHQTHTHTTHTHTHTHTYTHFTGLYRAVTAEGSHAQLPAGRGEQHK
jgi:hypothetical protein